MKYILSSFIFCSILLCACSAGKETGKSNSTTTNTNATIDVDQVETNPDINISQENLIMAEGHVRDRSREGCGYLIEVFVNNDSVMVEPLHFPEIHMEEGKHVKLTYRVSRRVSTCKNVTPIVIDKIIG